MPIKIQDRNPFVNSGVSPFASGFDPVSSSPFDTQPPSAFTRSDSIRPSTNPNTPTDWQTATSRHLRLNVNNFNILLSSTRGGCPSNPDCVNWIVFCPPFIRETRLEAETEEEAKLAALAFVEATLRKAADEIKARFDQLSKEEA